ncbi:MAG TPA: YbhB/YbcL family Raf kinase inhibitor-like protein [Acidimicrobiales bacterium]|nr:YbhB/YbcL family Raf kinase inhibitor-like protein [Acidimicrobiales bacterium]
MTVTSSLFDEGGTINISAAHPSVGGDNVSPDLAWSDPPAGTESFAVTCWDPDAPTTVGFCHLVLANLPPDARSLRAGAGAAERCPPGAVLGFTDFGESQYGGMAPPAGDPPHHYQFTVFALDVAEVDANEVTTYAKLRFLIRDHILASGTLTGRFGVSSG